jgi:hypothetical protein
VVVKDVVMEVAEVSDADAVVDAAEAVDAEVDVEVVDAMKTFGPLSPSLDVSSRKERLDPLRRSSFTLFLSRYVDCCYVEILRNEREPHF